jgi:sugar phosphate isomerase/epimerase
MQVSNKSITRRRFLHTGSCTLTALGLAPLLRAETPADPQKLFASVGLAAPMEKAAFLKQQGAEFLTIGVGDLLVPDQPEADFEKNLAKLAACPLPVLACNGFIRPKHLRCTGPDANHDLVLEWSDITFRRMKKAGGKFIVFGSGGARQVPDGWPKEKADEQFVALLKRMGPLAEAQGITVTIEQLQAKECNYINHIAEAATLIRAAGHPNIRLLADLYHMAAMGDTPADLKAAMDVIVHLEIAEKEGRTVPGVKGDDFRPFFKVLRETGYRGSISMEGKWQDNQIANAFNEIAKQAGNL